MMKKREHEYIMLSLECAANVQPNSQVNIITVYGIVCIYSKIAYTTNSRG